MTAIDLDHMKIDDKLELLNNVWNSIEQNASDVPSPYWHENVLKDRIATLNSTEFISLDTIKKQ